MSKLSQHAGQISDAVEEWLQPGNDDLKEAIDKTVSEGLFSFGDIKHQILALKSTITRKSLEIWAERSALNSKSLAGKKVLCLHAGNLPMVGFQDLLSVLMTGGSYLGKISRKDPYLLPAFLRLAEKNGLLEGGQWSTELEELTPSMADGVLFSGSEQTASIIKQELVRVGLIEEATPLLMRTAHFSMAFIPDKTPQTMKNLTEAVFRYGGSGCRSVGIVISPFSLNSVKCEFTDYVESFWLKNPQHKKPGPSLFYRFAFNKATNMEQAWLDDFLIEENLERPTDPFVLFWVKGDFDDFSESARKHKDGLQSLYSTAGFVGHKIDGRAVEPLSEAQRPPIWWEPDQINSIRWLQEKVAVH